MDTLKLVKEFLAERLEVPAERVVHEAKLVDLGVDSLMFAEMLFEFEDRMNTELDIRSADALPETVGQLLTLIETHVAAGASATPAPIAGAPAAAPSPAQNT